MSEKPLDLFAGHDPGAEPDLPGNYLTSTLTAGRRRAARHRALRTAAGTGLAAVAAVAMVATFGPANPGHGPAGSDNRGTTVAQDGARAFEQPRDAQSLLRNAALVASEKTLAPRNDQYVHTTYQRAGTKRNGESWIAVDGSRTGWSAGPGKKGGMERVALPSNPHPALDWPTYPFLTTLPTDPDALLALVRQEATERASVQPGDKMPDLDQVAFEILGELLHQGGILPPKLGAAVYQAAAKIPGVMLVPDAVDAAGRHGIGVVRADNQGWHRTEWIFDGRSFEYRGMRWQEQRSKMTFLDIAIIDRELVDRLPAGVGGPGWGRPPSPPVPGEDTN